MTIFSRWMIRSILLLFVTCGMAFSAPKVHALETKVLFDDEHPVGYAYAYPEGSVAKATPMEKDGKHWVDVVLKGDVWSGCGLGVNRKNLSPYLKNGSLQFYVRGAKGGETFEVGFVMAKGLKEDEKYALEVTVPVNRYAEVGKDWTLVTIPLADFPPNGRRWDEATQQNIVGPFKWDRVEEFVVSRGPTSDPIVRIQFGPIRVLPSYDKTKIEETKKQMEQKRKEMFTVKDTAVYFFKDAYPDYGGSAYAYPAGSASVEIVDDGQTGKGLKVHLNAAAWSGGAITHEPLDFTPVRNRGFLEFWIKGPADAAAVAVGFVDGAHRANVRIPISAYLPGAGLNPGQWTRVRIPLKDFPDAARKWDEATQTNLNYTFAWDQVAEFLFDNNGPGKNVSPFFLDEVRILPSAR